MKINNMFDERTIEMEVKRCDECFHYLFVCLFACLHIARNVDD